MPENKNIVVVTDTLNWYVNLQMVLVVNGYGSERRAPVSESIQPKEDSLEWYIFKAFGPGDTRNLDLATEAVHTGARVALLVGSEATKTSTLAVNRGIHYSSSDSVIPQELVRWLGRAGEIEYWRRARLNHI